MADFNVGNPADTTSRTFSLQDGNASKQVNFSVADFAADTNVILTYNVHVRDGSPTFSIKDDQGNKMISWSVSSDVRRQFQDVFSSSHLKAGTTSIKFTLENGDGKVDISNCVLWFQRKD
jgi:hypothetical protein